jgi:hypothetical protein
MNLARGNRHPTATFSTLRNQLRLQGECQPDGATARATTGLRLGYWHLWLPVGRAVMEPRSLGVGRNDPVVLVLTNAPEADGSFGWHRRSGVGAGRNR